MTASEILPTKLAILKGITRNMGAHNHICGQSADDRPGHYI